MFVLLWILFAIVVIVYFYMNKEKDYWRKRGVVQFDGMLRAFISGNRSISELYKDLYDKYPNEKHIGLFVGSTPALLLKDVADISFVLQGEFQKFHSRGIVTNPNDILADNLLFMNDYQRWKLLRQKLTPVFTHMKLKNMFYIMERCARDFVEFIENNSDIRNKPFNALYTYTTASIGASVFGIDTQAKNIMDCPFMDMAWKVFEPNFIGNLKFAISNYSPTLFRMLHLTTFGEHETFFVGVMKRVLQSRRKTKESRHDFIDTCLEIQESGILRDSTTGYELTPTDEVLAAQAFFFFIAGADPSATTMNFTLLELSYNPTILKRLHQEIDNVCENCKGTLSYEDINKLVYLDMVINESMRKYPPVGSIQRKCMMDTVLPSGLKMEKNTVALIPIFALHRDKQYYPKPEVFEPERHSSENISNHTKNIFLPFGGGNRICIGPRFARLQMKVGLALLLRRFTLREQARQPLHFEPSFFALRDTNATYDLIVRDLP